MDLDVDVGHERVEAEEGDEEEAQLEDIRSIQLTRTQLEAMADKPFFEGEGACWLTACLHVLGCGVAVLHCCCGKGCGVVRGLAELAGGFCRALCQLSRVCRWGMGQHFACVC